jgi:hypothetical protein
MVRSSFMPIPMIFPPSSRKSWASTQCMKFAWYRHSMPPISTLNCALLIEISISIILGSVPLKLMYKTCQGSVLLLVTPWMTSMPFSIHMLPFTQGCGPAIASVMAPISWPLTLLIVLEWKLPSRLTEHATSRSPDMKLSALNWIKKRCSLTSKRLAVAVLTAAASAIATVRPPMMSFVRLRIVVVVVPLASWFSAGRLVVPGSAHRVSVRGPGRGGLFPGGAARGASPWVWARRPELGWRLSRGCCCWLPPLGRCAMVGAGGLAGPHGGGLGGAPLRSEILVPRGAPIMPARQGVGPTSLHARG